MRNRGFLKFFIVLSLLFPAFSTMAGENDDVWPWPWGTECPFNWEDFDGKWAPEENKNLQSYVFELLSEGNGYRYFNIKRYNEAGEMIARGTGYSAPHQKIVRAALWEENGNGYWAIVRSYSKDQQKGCHESKSVTALTIRPFDRKALEADKHFVIQRVNDDDGPVQK